MFNKFILVVSLFFCIAFQSASAHVNDEAKFSIDTEKLFLESGRLFFESDYHGMIPLKSIDYLNDRCYIRLSLEVLKGDYMQGYQCNYCSYVLIKTNPGAPGSCPQCGRYDWMIM